MKLITVAGAPSVGKSCVILQLCKMLKEEGVKPAVVKFDSLSAQEKVMFSKEDIPCQIALAGGLCPDHYFVSNIENARLWAEELGADVLFSESAGLCSRCSPHIKEVEAMCVIDNLSGIHTPHKIGPMLRNADKVIITKGDIVSQAEREVFAHKVKQVNSKAKVYHINGLTGQGAFILKKEIRNAAETGSLINKMLRFTMPAALCSYCLGERKVGPDYQIGNTKTVNFEN